MEKVRSRIIQAIHRLILEMEATGKYEGLVTLSEYQEFAERVDFEAEYTRVHGYANSVDFLEWAETKRSSVASRRLRYEDMVYFGGQLRRIHDKHPVSDEERDRHMRMLRSCVDRRDGKRMLRQIAAELAGENQQVPPQTTTIVVEYTNVQPKRVDRVQNLEMRASRVRSETAKSLHAAGVNAISRREKIRLFKAAIREDSRGEQNGDTINATQPEIIEKKPDHEVRYHRLHDLVTERLEPVLVPVLNGNMLMGGEMIRALARFGHPGGFFGVSYLALNSLKKLVRRQYKTRLRRKPFDPTEFMTVVRILLHLNVLLEPKGKEHDRMISLSSHVNEATTPEAGRIIATVLALKRETSNGATGNHAG